MDRLESKADKLEKGQNEMLLRVISLEDKVSDINNDIKVIKEDIGKMKSTIEKIQKHKVITK